MSTERPTILFQLIYLSLRHTPLDGFFIDMHVSLSWVLDISAATMVANLLSKCVRLAGCFEQVILHSGLIISTTANFLLSSK